MTKNRELGEIYSRLQYYRHRFNNHSPIVDSMSMNKKELIYLHVAKILNRNIGDNLFKPLYWREQLTQCKISGIDLPRLLGGLEFSYLDISEIFALFGIIDLNLRDVPGIGHARVLLQESKKFSTILKGVLGAEKYVAIAITEAGAGSDLHNLETVALPIKSGYLLRGKKCFIARVEESSHLIVFSYVLQRKRACKKRKLTAFLVAKKQLQVIYEPINCTGFKGVSWGKITFQDLFIPAGSRIGQEGEGFKIFLHHFTYWRTVQSAAAVGSAYAAFTKALYHMQERNCFGGPIGRFSHLQQALAYHFSRLQMSWLLIEKIMERFDNGHFPYYEACMLKAEALEIAIDVVTWSMKVHGAKGCVENYLLEKRLRDLLALRIADGVTDVLRGQVARGILGRELYERSLTRTAWRGDGIQQ